MALCSIYTYMKTQSAATQHGNSKGFQEKVAFVQTYCCFNVSAFLFLPISFVQRKFCGNTR